MPIDNELRVVSRLIRDRDLAPALERGVHEDWFENEDAKRYWTHVVRHWSKYGEVPTVNALKLSFPGASFPRIEDTAEYLVDEFVAYRRRMATVRLLQDAGEILEEAHDHEAALAKMATGLAQIEDSTDARTYDIKLTDRLDSRVQRYLDLEGAFAGGLRGLPTGFPTIDKATSGLQNQQLVTIIAPPKTGKALGVDARVLTPTGWVRNGDLSVGDKVIGSDGTPTTVVAIAEWSRRPCYRVTVDDGGSVVADAEHEWTVHPHGYAPRTATTEQIRQALLNGKDRFAYLPVAGPVQYAPGPELPLHPYLLGVLLGDGALTQGSPRICKPDADLHALIQDCLPPGTKANCVDSARGDYRLVGTVHRVNPVLRALRALGLAGKRSPEKFVPEQYLTATVAERRLLLAGLLDTDGGVEGRSITFCSTSQALADAVRSLVLSLGGTARVKVKPHPRHQGGIGRTAFVVVLRLGFVPFRLPRKRETWSSRDSLTSRPPTRRIVAVERTHAADTRCIQVAAPDGLYVAEDFLVTHNSTLALVIADYIHQHSQKTPLFVSFEMSNDEQEARWIARRARLSHSRLLSGRLKREEKIRLRALKHLADSDDLADFILTDATSANTVSGLAGKIEKYKPDIVFVDGVYLMLDEITGESNTPQAITNNTRALKRLAQRFNIPIVISTQVLLWKMNKKSGVTADSIGYSSSFYQDSDVIIGLQRDDAEDDSQRTLRVVASRNCGPEEVRVLWDWETGEFTEQQSPLSLMAASLGDDDDV